MIGSSCIDEYYDMDYVPELGEKAVTPFLFNKIGGMIGNAAAVAASYGMDVYIMDTVNRSDNTKIVLDDCKKSGVKLDLIRYDEKLPDAKCMIMLKGGERIVYVVPKIKHAVEPDNEQLEIIKEADFVYTIIDELKQFKDPMEFIKMIHSYETKLVLDLELINNEDKALEWEIIKNTDILFANFQGDKQIKEKIDTNYKNILKEKGRLVVVTKGDKGCDVYPLEGDKISIEAYPVEPKDTTGAGDTFNASFIYALSMGMNEREAGDFANGAAANAIMYVGARSGAVGYDKVKEFIDEWRKVK